MSLELPKIQQLARKDTNWASTFMTGPGNKTGQGGDSTDESEEWAALNFPIHITLE
jgi:hypothetical protein